MVSTTISPFGLTTWITTRWEYETCTLHSNSLLNNQVMFADGLCDRWIIVDKAVLKDPCYDCEKEVEVLRSSEKDEAHLVTFELGSGWGVPNVYVKDGLKDEDRIYSSSYEQFSDEALENGGANVFLRNTGKL